MAVVGPLEHLCSLMDTQPSEHYIYNMIQHRICAEIKCILLIKANLPGTINFFH